jgi:hypothetical protein
MRELDDVEVAPAVAASAEWAVEAHFGVGAQALSCVEVVGRLECRDVSCLLLRLEFADGSS